jgi:large subunit ribosomal protein L4
MDAKVYRKDGKDAGRTVSLDPAVFDVEPNDHAIWLDVRAIQAAARQGTHKAKERNEVAGSTRKLYRQKGTGGARGGSAKSPIRKSGGTIFGPRPRDYKVAVNRKTKQVARRSALTYKARENAVHVVENFGLDAPSTRTVASLLKEMALQNNKVLVLTAAADASVYKSGRNLRKVCVRDASSLSTLDVLEAGALLVQEDALEVLSNLLGARTADEAAD